MSFIRFCKHFHLTRLSKPVENRVLYRAVKRHQVRSIVEIGVGDLERGLRLIKFADELGNEESKPVSYTGIDLFEGRGDNSGISLKEAHRKLKQTGKAVKLIPGDPYSALARGANGLQNTDLIIISADQVSEALDRAWFYVPRMMHQNTLVFLQTANELGECSFQLLSPADILTKSKSQDTKIRRAA